jgi:hypothetical protein
MRFKCKGPNIRGEDVGGIFALSFLAGLLTVIGTGILEKYVFIHWTLWILASFATGVLAMAGMLLAVAAGCYVLYGLDRSIKWVFAKILPAHDWKEVTTWFPWKVPENTKFGAPTQCIWFEKVWKRRKRSEYRDSATLFGRVSYCQNDPRLEVPHNTGMFFNEI